MVVAKNVGKNKKKVSLGPTPASSISEPLAHIMFPLEGSIIECV